MKQVNQALAGVASPGSVPAGFAQMHTSDSEEQLVHCADEDLYRSKLHHKGPTP